MRARLVIILAALLLLCLSLDSARVHGQDIDSVIHVKVFPGSDVGTKLTNAMTACNQSSAVPCILVLDPSLSSFGQGTLPVLCSNCYLRDWRSGQLTMGPSDLQRSARNWFDARTKGVVCGYDGAGHPVDNTASLAAVVNASNYADVQFHGCGQVPIYFNPGPSSGSSNLIFSGTNQYASWTGRGRNFLTVLQDLGLNASSAPLLTIGNGLKYQQSVDLENFQINGSGSPTMEVLTGGAGCTATNGIPTTGGHGTGFTVAQTTVDPSGAVLYVAANATGNGAYVDGDVLTSAQAGCVGATFKLHLVGSTNVVYPHGMLRYASANLEGLRNVSINNFSATSGNIGLTNDTAGGFPFLAEMDFQRVSVFMSASDPYSTAALLMPTVSNTTVFHSNFEVCTSCFVFKGVSGTPQLLFNGGHIERVGSGRGHKSGDAIWIGQANPTIVSPTVTNGNVYLDSSVFGALISYGGMQQGYYGFFSDSGLGNRVHITSMEHSAQPNDMRGDETYSMFGNVVSDPTFAVSGATGWTTTNATVAVDALAAPGAPVGQSLVVTPTTAGGYISQSFAVSASSGYRLTMAFYLTWVNPYAQVQVYDQSNALVWDTGQFTLADGVPQLTGSISPNGWRVVTVRLPSGATSYTVRVIAPNAGKTAQVALVSIVPSATVMTSPTLTGAASCSGSGVAYACAVAGSGAGGTVANMKWVPAAGTPNVSGFIQFHAVTHLNSDLQDWPVCYWGAGSAHGLAITLVAATDRDYKIPVQNIGSANGLSCQNFYGTASDASSFVISDLTMVPYDQSAGLAMKKCGSATFATATSAPALTCNGVTVNSTCNLSWAGAAPATAVNLFFTATANTVTAKASAAVSGTVNVACSIN